MHHFACHQWSKLQTKLTMLGYFRKSQTGWLRIYFSENPTSRNFSDLSLYPKEFQKKTCFYAWELFKNLWNHLEITRSKAKTHGSYMKLIKFLYIPGNSSSSVTNPGNSTSYFFNTTGNHLFSIPCLDFLLTSPFWGVLVKNLPKSSLKWQFLLVKNKLKILNWRITDAKSIKFTLHVCHLNTFLLLRTVGVNWRAAESISRKTIKNAKNLSNSWLPLLKISS